MRQTLVTLLKATATLIGKEQWYMNIADKKQIVI